MTVDVVWQIFTAAIEKLYPESISRVAETLPTSKYE